MAGDLSRSEAEEVVARLSHQAHCKRLFEGNRDRCLEDQAADLLTRLSAERDRLEGERDSLLPDDPWHWKNRAIKAEAELDALKAMVAEVLEPFAALPGEGSEDFGDMEKVVARFGRTTDYTLRLGHLRRASELHATLSGERT